MEAFIQSLSAKLNIPESSARSALQVVLKFLSDKTKGTELEPLIDRVPGARMLLETKVETPEGSPGALGGLLGTMGGMFAGQAGDLMRVTSQLQQAGVDTAKIVPFVETFLTEARQTFGDDVVEKLLQRIPALRTLDKSPEN